MWFKNILPYRLTKPLGLSIEQLEQQLSEFKFTPTTSQEISKLGFSSALGNKISSSFVHGIGENFLICLEKEEKILPASVIKEELDERINVLENDQARPARKAEKDALKEDIISMLLPRAFSRRKQVRALIMPKIQMVLVDNASSARAEELLSLLRKAIGSLPLAPVSPVKLLDQTMTDWVKSGTVGYNLSLLEEAELSHPSENGGKITVKQLPLDSDEINAHLESGMQVTELGLEWGDALSFILNPDMALKRLSFSEEIVEQNQDIDKEDPASRLDADLTLMCGELELFLPELFQAIGGLEDI